MSEINFKKIQPFENYNSVKTMFVINFFFIYVWFSTTKKKLNPW